MCVISIVLNLTKSQWAGFSTSTIPQGYCLPLIFFPFISTIALAPTTANGMDSRSCCTCFLKSSSSSLKLKRTLNFASILRYDEIINSVLYHNQFETYLKPLPVAFWQGINLYSMFLNFS